MRRGVAAGDCGINFSSLEGTDCNVCSTNTSAGVLEPKMRGPMDKYTTVQARQTVLNTPWKKEERKNVCKFLGPFFSLVALYLML